MDGCYIFIKCFFGGFELCKEYYNFKNFYLVVIMGVVDLNYWFIWGICGFFGNLYDVIVF